MLLCVALSFANFSFGQGCSGSLGEPIFWEDFGVAGGQYGPPLPAGQTTYQYIASPNVHEGFYTITSNAKFALNAFHESTDHTITDTNGYMLVVNADFSPDEFYRRRVTGLCENSEFEFSSWIMNVLPPTNGCNPSILPDVLFEIRTTSGDLLGSISTGDIVEADVYDWRRFGIQFNTSNFTEVDVIMINNAPGGCGNDLAIDDIQFRACGDNATIETSIPVDDFCFDDVPDDVELIADLQGNVYDTPVFQWQVSNDGGTTWNSIAGATSSIYNLSPVVEGQFFRFLVANSPSNLANPSCSVISDEIEVIIHPEFTFSIDGIQNYCDNETIELTVSGNGGIDEVNWTTPNGNTQVANPLTIAANVNLDGSFQANITDTNGCTYTESYVVAVEETATTSIDVSGCVGDGIVLANNEQFTITQTEQIQRVIPRLLNGCDSILNYLITASPSFNFQRDSLVCYGDSVLSPEGNTLTLYRDTLLNYSFLTAAGCDSLVNVQIEVPQPTVTDLTVCENDVIILPTGEPFVATTSFQQFFTIPTNGCDLLVDYSLTVIPETESIEELTGCPFQPFQLPTGEYVNEPGTYSRELVNAAGCDSTVNYIVEFVRDSCDYRDLCRVQFPSGITPNGDQINDRFQPFFAEICEYENYRLEVFNRWGEKIFVASEPLVSGMIPSPDMEGVFLYAVSYDLILEDGTTETISDAGVFNILR